LRSRIPKASQGRCEILVPQSFALERFVRDEDWVPLKGTYLWPLKLFAAERSRDPGDYLEVLRIVDVLGTDVAITRGGGLFVRDTGRFGTVEAMVDLANLFNVLLCEFAFNGLEPEPVTMTDVQSGKLIERHASLTNGFGNYAHKTYGPLALLSDGARALPDRHGRQSENWAANYFWTCADASLLSRLDPLPNAKRLLSVSPTLPALVAAAVNHAARGNSAEAVLTNWIVAEQILSYCWRGHVETVAPLRRNLKYQPDKIVPDKARKDRLRDTRTYTASVQAEVLLTAGTITAETYAKLQAARKIRNDLAHGAKVDFASVQTTIAALHAMLLQLGVAVDRLPSNISSVRQTIRAPRVAVEPEFPFR
jgi:hypothetical protein